MSGAASPTTERPITRGRVRQDLAAVATRARALLPALQNAQDAAGALTDAPHMHVAISAAEEAQLHAASAALQSDNSHGTDDDSRTQAAPQAADPAPPTRTAATVRANLITAGMRDDSAQEKALLDAVVASVVQDSRAPGATAPPPVSAQEPRPAVELPRAEPVRRTAQAGNAQQHGLIDTRGNNHTSPRSLRSTFGLTLPATLRPTRSALHGAASPTLRRLSLQRPPPLPEQSAHYNNSALPAFPVPYAQDLPSRSAPGFAPCGSLQHGSAECPALPPLQAPVPQPVIPEFGRSSFGMRARKPNSFSGKPDENVTHWVRAMEKHLRVASVRGTAEQLITYVSQYLEGAADNWDHRRNRDRMGAPQEALADWLAALEDEFRPIESAILLRTKFKRITQGGGTLKDYVADFRSKRDEASAVGATIADEAARDGLWKGLPQ